AGIQRGYDRMDARFHGHDKNGRRELPEAELLLKYRLHACLLAGKGFKGRVTQIFLHSSLFILLSTFLMGCVPLMVGATVGALGGYAISKDTVCGETDRPYESLWSSAMIVSKIRGKIRQEDKTRGYIEFEVDSSLVRINVIKLTRTTNRLKISARKYGFPNLSLSQDLFVKILEEVK
ncbi:MAG: hypothetical protein QMD94_05860, partial [Candidatus Omnitrophota bacterium]|nr:hypothetical protein [Candidatus Omnitrophota bacterium]